MDLILIVVTLGAFLELFLLVKFKLLQIKIRRLQGTGKIRDIEAAYNWKTLITVLLVTIPLVSIYIYF